MIGVLQPDRHARAARGEPRRHHAAADQRRAGHRSDTDATCVDARLHLRPYSEPAVRRRGGGGGLADRAAARRALRRRPAVDRRHAGRPASTRWRITGASWRSGRQPSARTVDRAKWRLVGLVHCRRDREQAYRDVEHGIEQWFRYFQAVAAFPQMAVEGGDVREMIDFVNDVRHRRDRHARQDAAAQIERLDRRSPTAASAAT